MMKIDTSDLDRVLVALNKRAAFMVRDLVALGRHAADEYALMGGAHRRHPGRFTYLRRRGRSVRRSLHRATGAQQARMIEREAHGFFPSFFDPNW